MGKESLEWAKKEGEGSKRGVKKVKSRTQRLPEHVLLCTGSTRAVQSLFKIVYNEKYSELVVLYSLGVWRRVCLRGKHFILINLDKYYRFY